MKSRSPVLCIISLCCGVTGVFVNLIALVFALMASQEERHYHSNVYITICLGFLCFAVAFVVAAVTLGILGITLRRRLRGCAIAGLASGSVGLLIATRSIINVIISLNI